MTNDARQVRIGRDANDNVIITGDSNVVIFQTARVLEPEGPAAVPEIGPNPYKGLAAFQEKDANFFFGREELIKHLRAKFGELHEPQPGAKPLPRILPILGPSGSGKSSVVRAGLIPELAREPLPGRQSSHVALMSPGAHPLEALAAVLARVVADEDAAVRKVREFVEELKIRNEQGGYDGLRRIVAALRDIDVSPLILFVDQFEEIYSHCDDAQERERFVENLLTAAADRSGHTAIILTLRTDFIGQTIHQEEFNQVISTQGVIVPVMKREELRSAIAEPARHAGHPLDDATVELLISETRGREGVLPLLQFALTRIWEGMARGVKPSDTLREIGGVGGALAREAQRLYDSLQSDADKAIARRAFLRLIRVGKDIPTTRRTLKVQELVGQGEDSNHVKAVLNRFAAPGARIITLSAEPDGTEIARLTHEALIDNWAQLQEWIKADYDDLLFQYRLEEASQYWDVQKRAPGLLWRSPDLDRLTAFRARDENSLTPVQIAFHEKSKKEARKARLLNIAFVSIVGVLLVSTAVALFIVFIKPVPHPANTNGNTNTRPSIPSSGNNNPSANVRVLTPLTGDNNGIDITYYQGRVDWSKLDKSKIKFVFLRAGVGTKKDRGFERNWQGYKAVGILRGAYHIYSFENGAKEQATAFLQALGADVGELPPVLDLEPSLAHTTLPDAATLAAAVKIWLDVVEHRTGRKPIIYAYKAFWDEHLTAEFGGYPLWIGSYSSSEPSLPKGWNRWTFWQYSQSGTVDGISGPINLNRFNGSEVELQRFANAQRH
ncbi:MAG TPA: GH25 family lysozyme [Blastocatellia bacterium]|nr:GH25 family lysozyme [Blastocatellia bacterium]